MNISSITSLFKKKENTHLNPDSFLIKKLKEVANTNFLSIYENITIYHHTHSYSIPLLLLDPSRGIYLFEYKDWSYNDLKGASISKASNQKSDDKTLAFENTHKFIKQKFNELTHSDGVDIHNYLLMPNLNSDEYAKLEQSFKTLLPEQKVLFHDSIDIEILRKIKDAPKPLFPIKDKAFIMGNLLVQYLILSENDKINLATPQQIEFIESKEKGHQVLSGKSYSGKTSAILLKAILENLRQPELKIIIIEPTALACDFLKKQLLNIVEYAIIEVDIMQIEIITPITLVNKHLTKLKKPTLDIVLHIDETLMRKNFKVADLIICDDSNLLDLEFLDYLEHIQKKASLILVSSQYDKPRYTFDKSFKTKDYKVHFKKANQFAKTLQLITKLLETNEPNEILIIGNNISKNYLKEDLEFFVDGGSQSIDASQNLENQNFDNLLLCSYSQTGGIHSKFTILLDVEEASLNEIEYAINLAEEASYVIYEDESQNIQTLKEKYD